MVNKQILFRNLPSGPVGVKSEVWIESYMPYVDWTDSGNIFTLKYILLNNPEPETYFEFKIKDQILRFVWRDESTNTKKITKTDYGFEIEILRAGTTSESWFEMTKTFMTTKQISDLFQITIPNLIARNPGTGMLIDYDFLLTTPTISDYHFNYGVGEPSRPDVDLVGLTVFKKPNFTDDYTGKPINTVFARIQMLEPEVWSFMHRIDEFCLPELEFQLPRSEYLVEGDPLWDIQTTKLDKMVSKIIVLAQQINGDVATLQEGYFSESQITIVRSGISNDTVKRVGQDWFTQFVIDTRAGVLSYYDSNSVIGWNKFCYFYHKLSYYTFFGLYAFGTFQNLDGETITSPVYLISEVVASGDEEIVAFNIGNAARRVVTENIATGYPDYFGKLISYTCFIGTAYGTSTIADIGEFQVVPETFGSFAIFYENDLGGLSDAIFLGGKSEGIEIEKSEYVSLGFNSSSLKHSVGKKTTSIETPTEAHTGPLTKYRLKELLEMLYTENVWLRDEHGQLIPIVIEPSKAKITSKDEVNGVYSYSLSITFRKAFTRSGIAFENQ